MATPEPTTPICPLTDIDDRLAFFLEGRYQGRCAHCGRIKGSYEVHHVVYRQRCRREGAPQWSPDNALRLCSGGPDRCHEREHSAQGRVRVSRLRDENIAFAARWLGSGAAYEYFHRYYEADADPRLDALLEQP